MAQREEILEEDQHRAQLYGLMARTLVRPPDDSLLAALREIEGNESEIGIALNGLALAANAATIDSIEDEFQELFIGVGRGELVPFGSYYLTGFLNEKPLARLRQEMARLGIERADGVAEPEDHIGSVCEIMAGLIQGDFGSPMPVAEQAAFFERHIGNWAGQFFKDLETAKSATFYRPVGALGRVFLEIETTAFEMAA